MKNEIILGVRPNNVANQETPVLHYRSKAQASETLHQTAIKELCAVNAALQLEIEQIRQREEELTHFFELIPDALIVITFNKKLVRINSAFCCHMGYPPDELKNIPLKYLIHPEDIDMTRAYLEQVKKEPNHVYFENRFLTKDGTYRNLSWTATSIAKKELIYAVGKDITQQKQLRKKAAVLEKLNFAGEMAINIGHEIRNPLTTVRGYLQRMSLKAPDKLQDAFQLMITELDHSNAIISQFLFLARNKSINRKWQNLNTIISALAHTLELEANLADQTLCLRLGNIPDMLLDEQEIAKLLVCLCNNALEASSAKHCITISTSVEGNKGILSVSDTGCGMPDEVVERLGTPFFTTKPGGIGLGLAVCYSIAARHNLTIDVQSSPRGTTVSVFFPL
ncbi:ATP-binding protein [Anaerospora sp.]|uniref:ATP-binding protein n=1 Tax=Anaerospora sp. TaxID=1960278 RepID=UPI002899CBF0|nr:ATP-binding protein [Anaerospora sp.]